MAGPADQVLNESREVSSKRVAAAWVLHESRGSIKRQRDSQVNREKSQSESVIPERRGRIV
eukprot:1580883-Pyramimonas_sp.AAC.1